MFRRDVSVGRLGRRTLGVVPNRYMAQNVDGRSFHGTRILAFFAVESDQSLMLNSPDGNPSQSAPGWFGLRCLVSRLTYRCQFEAAPNSYTGSGPRLFPTDDGDHVSDRAPETSPCHGLARQVGELDPPSSMPGGDESSKATSAASRAAQGVASLPRFASAQLDVGSARGQPRKILLFVHAQQTGVSALR